MQATTIFKIFNVYPPPPTIQLKLQSTVMISNDNDDDNE